MLSLQEKLDLWVSITGVNPTEDKKKYTIYFDGRLSDYDIKRMNDRITETLQDDESGMFAEAYLGVYLKQFLEKKNISLLELIENKELTTFVDDVKTLHNSLKETDAESLIINEAKKAMDFYKLPCNLNVLSIIELRSSALKCMNGKLNLLQFSAGNKKADSFKLSKDIYMFKNLDALILCSARGNLNGVTLGYIKDEEDLTASYFAFIIKNGDNLYLLTDMPKYTHPAQKRMKRCPGRDMSNRIESNWFPYDTIANIDTSNLWDSGRYGVSETNKEKLSTVINEDMPYSVIGTIESLAEHEAFWFIMMVSLIKKKFYEEEIPSLPLSYTRSMINSPLLNKTENALVVQKVLPSIELGEVSIKDTDNLEFERKNEKHKGTYNYLIDRYKDKVDTSVLNVFKNTDKSSLIEDKYPKKNIWGEKTGCEYLSLDLDNATGTKEQIEHNQKWIARYNYAKEIRKLVKADYEDKASKIYEEIRNIITPRIETLIEMHLKEELQGYDVKNVSFGVEYTEDKTPFSYVFDFDKWYNSGESVGNYRYGVPRCGNKSDCKCYFTNKSAGVALVIKPKSAKELAIVCGISEKELPEELQHYDCKIRRYMGNDILDDIDPFLTIIRDDFNSMEFKITILLSKNKYLDFCKKAGVDAVKFWENEKPVCFSQVINSDKCKGKVIRKWNRQTYDYDYNLTKKCQNCKWYKENLQNQ